MKKSKKLNWFKDHYIKFDLNKITQQSLAHCHCKNLHSIVLDHNSFGLIRLFYSDNSDLWKNEFNGQFLHEMSIAIHPHHCGITIIPLFGEINNYLFCKSKLAKPNAIELNSFKYQSPITKNIGHFEKVGQTSLVCIESKIIENNYHLLMGSHELHTVFVPKNQQAAWIIYEFGEDKEYDSTCYSNADLTKFSFDGLYQKITKNKVKEILFDCGLI